VNFDPRQLFNLFSRMSSRERTLVSVSTLVLVVAALYSLVIDPLTSGEQVIARSMKRKEQDLKSLAQLRYDYIDLSQKLAAGETMLAKTSKDFSLFAYLESTISQVTPGRIGSMNRSNKTAGDQYEEEMVEFKLTQVSLDNIVDMLHRIEKAEHPLRVTRLSIKERTGATHDFDVTATVSLVRSLQRKDEEKKAPAAPEAEENKENHA
jgi:type II secretory pathway component PulM